MVLLAGCATGPKENTAQAPNWEGEGVVTAPIAVEVPILPPAPAPVVVPPAPAAPSNQPAETWVPLSRWCKANDLPAPCLVGPAPMPAYALSMTGGVFVLRVGSRVAHWDGLEVRLGFAPQMMSGQPYVHTLDLKKTLEPLVLGSGMSFLKTNPTIVIDPGHGGQDSGTKSVLGYRCEKDFTLDWARRLGALLATNGWQVFLTRNYDTDLSISNRVVFAEAHKAGVFLSLHFNSSAPNDQQSGLETYCLTPTGMPSTVTRGYHDDAALAFPNDPRISVRPVQPLSFSLPSSPNGLILRMDEEGDGHLWALAEQRVPLGSEGMWWIVTLLIDALELPDVVSRWPRFMTLGEAPDGSATQARMEIGESGDLRLVWRRLDNGVVRTPKGSGSNGSVSNVEES